MIHPGAAMPAATFFLMVLFVALFGAGARAQEPGYLEKAVCGALTERVGFFLLRAVAGRPRLDRSEAIEGLEPVSFRTKDQRLLGGYKHRAIVPAGLAPRGYVLVTQGNAMLAEHTVPVLRFFAQAGFDAFAFDFRGYGTSEGRSRMAAILSDYVEIIGHLNGKGYTKSLLYGMSLGGVIFLNAIGAGVSFDAAVIDSAPSRITRYGCPSELNPVDNVPRDCSNLMVIVGGSDRVVPPKDSRELAESVAARGGTIVRRDEFAHPFQDVSIGVALARLELVREFFEGTIGR